MVTSFIFFVCWGVLLVQENGIMRERERERERERGGGGGASYQFFVFADQSVNKYVD